MREKSKERERRKGEKEENTIELGKGNKMRV
jgi:hypothetical protein